MEAKLVSPWVLFYRKIEALFAEDPNVRVRYHAVSHVIEVNVSGIEKADALKRLLPAKKTFGNVTVHIDVISSDLDSASKLELFRKAFDGNRALAYIRESGDSFFDLNYVVFCSKVVQYRSDDIGDVNDMTSTLYQDLAKDIFEDAPGIYFCTEAVRLT